MAFGLILDVPLLAGAFALLAKYSVKIVKLVLKIRLPKIVLALLVSLPLISFEENINCGAFNCQYALIPPTMWFLLVFNLLYLLISSRFKIKGIIRQVFYFSIFGMAFEFFLGIAKAELKALLVQDPLAFILIMVWVGFSYAFIIYLPLLIINESDRV